MSNYRAIQVIFAQRLRRPKAYNRRRQQQQHIWHHWNHRPVAKPYLHRSYIEIRE